SDGLAVVAAALDGAGVDGSLAAGIAGSGAAGGARSGAAGCCAQADAASAMATPIITRRRVKRGFIEADPGGAAWEPNRLSYSRGAHKRPGNQRAPPAPHAAAPLCRDVFLRMPELPEVETTRRGIAPHVIGRRVERIVVYDSRLRWPVPADLDSRMRGRTIDRVDRRSKYLLFHAGDSALLVHLGMTGTLRLFRNPH